MSDNLISHSQQYHGLLRKEFMFVITLMILHCLWKSCVIWLDVRGNPFQTVCFTMWPAYEEHELHWFKQWSRLIAMIDTLGLPAIFFTHIAADLQWPELARLICPDNHECSSSRGGRVVHFTSPFFINNTFTVVM